MGNAPSDTEAKEEREREFQAGQEAQARRDVQAQREYEEQKRRYEAQERKEAYNRQRMSDLRSSELSQRRAEEERADRQRQTAVEQLQATKTESNRREDELVKSNQKEQIEAMQRSDEALKNQKDADNKEILTREKIDQEMLKQTQERKNHSEDIILANVKALKKENTRFQKESLNEKKQFGLKVLKTAEENNAIVLNETQRTNEIKLGNGKNQIDHDSRMAALKERNMVTKGLFYGELGKDRKEDVFIAAVHRMVSAGRDLTDEVDSSAGHTIKLIRGSDRAELKSNIGLCEEIFSSDGEPRRREDRARAQIRADQEQRRRDLEESERRAEEERRQYDRERRREQERLEALQRLEDALRMELRQRELERQLAAQAEKDRIEKIIRDLILTAEEEFKVGKEELRKEHQSVMRKIREFHKNALEMKRIDFKLAEGILSVAIDGIKEMMKIDKEEHRSEIKRHELTKREMVEKHQETILSEILLTSTFEEDMQEHELQHQLKLENIEKKSEIDKANFDKAVRADILENKFNRAVQRTKRAGCSLSDAMEILNESIGSLQDEDGEQTLTRARNRQIGITRVNHGLNDLSEAAENILRLHGLDVEEDSTNKEISTQILDDIGTARECLSQLVNSDEETLLETFQMLSEKTSFLSSLAVDILLEIALQNHVVNAIEKSNLELFECCTGAIED